MRFWRSLCLPVVFVLVAALFPGVGGVASGVGSSPSGVTLTGLDAHDGTVLKSGDTYYLYGTRYGCGFQWQNASSPFCGFGVWTSSAVGGPWAFQGLLFDPNGVNTTRNEVWRTTCNINGNGCFNPRMVQRYDGVWILYFNAPADVGRGRDEAYYAMGCNGPAGPCGAAAGPPHGSTYQMPLQACNMQGDFSIIVDGATAYLACSSGTITIEQLDVWWVNGVANNSTGAGAVRGISYLSNVEAPGFFKAPDGMWVMTYSDPMCGYCAGTGTSYSVAQAGLANTAPATSPLGVWLPPTNVGWNAPATGRRSISGTSCGGQPRTVFTVDGQPYQWIDLWYGGANETSAGVRFEPIVLTGQAWRAPANGTVWQGAIRPFTCGSS